jgi:hypothetical protein
MVEGSWERCPHWLYYFDQRFIDLKTFDVREGRIFFFWFKVIFAHILRSFQWSRQWYKPMSAGIESGRVVSRFPSCTWHQWKKHRRPLIRRADASCHIMTVYLSHNSSASSDIHHKTSSWIRILDVHRSLNWRVFEPVWTGAQRFAKNRGFREPWTEHVRFLFVIRTWIQVRFGFGSGSGSVLNLTPATL